MESLETFCRGCLVKYDDVNELIQYTEKNRRQFVYSTGVQVKRSDYFSLQLCKECYINMKMSCKFRKQCRTSEKKFRNYMAMRAAGDEMDFCTYLKNSDLLPSFPFMNGYSTPNYQKQKDDDNESTTTSIRNFVTDLLGDEVVPETEARIIKEVIEEEVDIQDDSLDSHWLQDDVSIDMDFQLDLSFSPFSTPKRVTNSEPYNPLKSTDTNISIPKYGSQKRIVCLPSKKKLAEEDRKVDSIDLNLERALSVKCDVLPLESLIKSPASKDYVPVSPVKSISNLIETSLDNLDVKSIHSESTSGMNTVNCLEEFLRENQEDKNITSKNASDKLETDNAIEELLRMKTENQNNLDNQSNDRLEVENCLKEMLDEEVKTDEIKNDSIVEQYYTQETNNKVLNFYIPNSLKDKNEIEKDVEESNENDQKSNENIDMDPINPTNPFECTLCNKELKNYKALSIHFSRMHKIKFIDESKKEAKEIICPDCGKMFKGSNFYRHYKSHAKKERLKCDICKFSFSSKGRLSQHRKTHIEISSSENIPAKPKRTYYCNICGAASSNLSNLKVHQMRHNKTFTVFCDVCNKGYYRKSDLAVHFSSHTGERPLSCEMCSKTFRLNTELIRHRRKVHTGEKPFQCNHCNKSFYLKSILKNHLKSSKRCIQKR